MTDQLYADADLAARLRISRSWIRKQRMYRRQGLAHCLTIDPVMIGSVPRYKASEVKAWIDARRVKVRHSGRATGSGQ